MNGALALTFAATVPFLLLGLVLWLARLEETLTDGLEASRGGVPAAPADRATVAPAVEAPGSAAA
jgi:hypothetical protein